MRIYTLTFQFASNFGAVLQMFALYQYLKLNGHEVEVIDYWPKYALLNERWYSNGFSSIKSLSLIPIRLLNSITFNIFVKKNIKLTRKCTNIQEICALPSADVIFVGSDQVWNPDLLGEINDAYFLNFDTTSLKVSYAASMGQDVVSDEIINRILPMIRKFDIVTVREDYLCKLLSDNGVSSVRHVVDPVFLLDASIYRSIAKRKIHKKYVLTYYSDDEAITEKLATKIAKENNCIVLKIGSYRNKNGIIGTKTTSVEEFLGLIDGAEYIVTPSFHCIAFSIIFKKDFYAIHAGNRSSRITSLLDSMGLVDRFIQRGTKIDDLEIRKINYDTVAQSMENIILNSKDYINKILKRKVDCD